MRKITLILVASVFSLGLFSFNWMSHQKKSNEEKLLEGLEMSEDVQTIIDNSCFGCHHTDSKNDKGKKKLNFDSFGGDYSSIKSASKLKEIAEVVSEEEMPPKKFLEHYPEKALTDDQKSILSQWALQESKKYLAK
jgi:hypothetical protein